MKFQRRNTTGLAVVAEVTKPQAACSASGAIWLMCVCLALDPSIARGAEPPSDSNEAKDSSAVKVPESQQLTRVVVPREALAQPKVIRYAQHLLAKYDRNRDGRLQKDEWNALHGHPESIDVNGDGDINLDELTHWIADYGWRKRIGVPLGLQPATEHTSITKSVSPVSEEDAGASSASVNSNSAADERQRHKKFVVPANRLPAGLPEWFFARDQDGDGQLTVGEFCPTGGAAELAEFASYDANGDGCVTAKECVHKSSDKPTATAKETNESRATELDSVPTKPSRNRRKRRTTP